MLKIILYKNVNDRQCFTRLTLCTLYTGMMVHRLAAPKLSSIRYKYA